MLVGEAAQKARGAVQGLPPLLKWPKQAESAGPWAMLALFAGALRSVLPRRVDGARWPRGEVVFGVSHPHA